MAFLATVQEIFLRLTLLSQKYVLLVQLGRWLILFKILVSHVLEEADFAQMENLYKKLLPGQLFNVDHARKDTSQLAEQQTIQYISALNVH